MSSASTLLMSVCLLATIYSTLGMQTVVYKDGNQVCEVCAENHVPYRQQSQTYYPSNGVQRVVYRTEERIVSQPSTSYITNRGDNGISYSNQEACRPSPCGQNTNCEVVAGRPTCSCVKGYVGNPLSGCRHECESDGECGSQEYCKDFKCQSACDQCGISAQCSRVTNHRAICECPKNYILGSPYTECKAECYGDRDCPAGRPACFYGICKNPCDGACGIGADCNLRGLTPICSCPRDMTGDPFVRCRPFTKEDLCIPNPCGQNAQCVPGHDNTGKERPVCTCLPGYTGNPLSYCARGECQSDVECSDNRSCQNYACVDPCIGQCGSNAICEARRHVAVCRCPQGYNGDALVSCRQARLLPVPKYYKKK